MRLVRLADLSEEERKKALEEQQERLNKNRQEAQNIQSQANNDFNDYIKKHGAYDTNQHTTSLGDIKKAYKNTSSYDTVKNSLNNYYNNNNTSIWNDVKSTFNNLMLSGKNGVTQMFKGAETQLESNKNYKMRNKKQFYTSKNVSDIAKAQAKIEDNNVLNNKIKNNITNDEITNKLPLANVNTEKIDNESRKYKNSISNGKIDTNLTRNYLQNNIDKTSEEIQKNTNNINNEFLRKANEQVVPALGQMGAGMIASAINPALGTLYFTESATGGYYDDAKQRGMDDNEARKYSTIMGAMEGATEQIGIENISKAGKGIKALVKGTGKETIKQGTKEITQSNLKTVLKNYGIGIADNIMQEAIIDPIQELTAQTIAGKDKAQWKGIGQRMLQDGINGGLVSAILGGANLGIQSCTGIVEKMQNNRTVTYQELQTAVKDAGQQLDTSKMMMDSVEQQVSKYKDYYTGKQVDSNTQDVLNQAQNIIDNNSTQNLQQNTIQNQINQQMQQVTPVQNENASNLDMITNNLKDEAINEIKNSKILETSKKEMLEVLNNIDNVTENDLNAIKQTINEVNKSELETNVTYKDSLARKRNYIKYKDDTNTYDSKAVNEVLDSMPSNRNGNKTVKQWLQVANELGKRISDKSNSEIEQIAYKSWFDVQPSKNITKYDNVNKTNVGFQKLTADNWINAINNAVLQEREQIIQQQNKMAQNGNIGQLNDITISTTEKQVKSIIKDFNESAKQYNIDYSNEDLKEINQMFNKRGIKAYFDENTFKNNNDVFSVWKPVIDEQGNVSGREVVFNPKAKDSKVRVQELAIHELGHDLDLNEVQDMILKDASRKENWESARKSLENTYREAYNNDGINISEEDFNKIVDEEATMSILQRELGSQEYVNRLVNQNQSIAKKIYNWVIDKLNKFTVGKNEKIFWEDIKNKFETAYNQEFNKNDSNIYKKYSIQTDNNGNKYVKVDTDQNIFDGIDKKDYNKIAKMYIQDYLMGKTKLSDNDTAVIDRKSANKYTNPGKKQQNFDKKMQLTPELKNVLEIAQKDSISLPIKSNSKYQNWEYYKFDFELSGKKFNGTVNIGIDSNGNKHFYEINKIKEVDDISGTSLNRSSTSLSNNSLPLPQKNVNSQPLQKYSMQESENNSGSFSFEKNAKRYEDLLLSNTLNYNKRDNGTLNIEMYNGKELINQFTVGSKEETIKQLGNDISNYIYENANENIQTLDLKQQDKNNYKPVTHKEKQLDIIKKTNPMLDDYHVGIRKIEDIKTFEEAIQDEESFSWGDYSKKDAERDLKRNKVRVYSSYAIKNGTFVSTSYEQALEYAGMDRSKVHSKEIRPLEVAWINGDEGQYANINQKYALPTKEWQQFLEDNYQKQGTGKNLKEYNLPTKEDLKTKLNLPTKENINKQDNQTTQGEKIDWNEIERPEGKIRKHYRSIIESSNTTKEAKAIAKELMGADTYVPETNKGQLAQADYRINNSSPEAELKSLMNRVIQGEKVSSVDIAVGERLIQYYSKIGDKTNLQEAIQTTAMAGTSAGQTVQALAMLNHQTPEGQATWIQRSVDKMNNELAKRKGGTITKDEEGNIKVVNKKGQDITDKVDLFDLTPDMIDKIVSSKNKTEMYDNIDQVYEDLGQQVPLSTMEKIDSWRYFSMLANPKTHIRNMVGNVAMGKTQSLKDKLAGGIEDIVGTFNKDMERTKTLRPADAKTKEFAKNDVLNPDVQSMMELNENKYNPQSRLQNARKTFKNDALENTLGRLFNWNDKLLEAEDALGLKSAYKKALTDYLTANKIDVDNITDKQLSKARNYAVEQAKEATFHQANSLATWINQASTNNKIVKGAKDAILPFVKTPLNVAKTGIEYNPVGLLKTITYDTVKLRKGDITVNKYIDNLSKGLTGTGIAVLGYALADAGILKASGGDDDKKEKYDEALGKQTYSITIGERTYSLDWLSPVGIPLFVGAEANALRNSQQKEKNRISSDDDKKYNQTLKSLENLANAMSNSMSPMSEMSMISGLTSALSSYEKDKTSAVITNAIKSYVNQFVPTVLGQIARTTDDYERSTTSTKSSGLSKAIDQTKLQLMSKIPGLRQKLPTKEDIWGNEQKAEPNIPLRVVNNFVNPSTVKNINTSKVDEELDNLYNKIGESTILPSTIEKTYTINGQTYRMTNEEYSEYKKNYGQTSYKLLDDLINSNDYNKLSDEQKQKAIENIYSYAKEANKVDYAKNNNETVKTSTLYDTLEELKQKGGNQSSYLNYIAKTKDITGEDSSKKKIEVLANSDYSDKTKEIIYKNTEGSNDKKIILVDKLKLPINEYLNYKSQKFENDKDTDGETISGSKKQKVYDYLNSISNKELSQDYKKIICKIENINDYDNDIVNFINNSKNLNYSERTEILKDIGFKIDKDGKIQTKSMIPIYKYVK